jgi:hypothetical protein
VLGAEREAFNIACEGKARLLATALLLQRINLPPARQERFETLRIGLREQSRLLDVSSGPDRVRVLDRLGSMRRELSILIEEGETSRKADALASTGPLVAGGGALVLPLMSPVGGKLLIVTAGPILTVLDLPQLTKRVERLMNGTEDRKGWLAGFVRDTSNGRQQWRQLVETIGEELWNMLVGPLMAALQDLGVAAGSRLVLLPRARSVFCRSDLRRSPRQAGVSSRTMRSFMRRAWRRCLERMRSPRDGWRRRWRRLLTPWAILPSRL